MAGSSARAVMLCLGLAACSDDSDLASDAATSGAASGEQPDGCGPGTAVAADGSCVEAGVPPENCAPGFVAAGRGCDPVLPAQVCGDGMMAIPGEDVCRSVAPCAPGTYGDIAVERSTQHVDGSFTGVGDGSAASPWSTIQAAVDAAEPEAMVAIAAGTYVEEVVLHSKRVRLWGRCPELVHIDAPLGSLAAVVIVNEGSSGAEVQDLAVTGAASGIAVSGAADVVIQRVRAHDTAHPGMRVDDELGVTSATIADSLVEGSVGLGIEITGTAVLVQRTVVRETQSLSAGTFGRGINAQSNTGPADLAVETSLVEQNHGTGILVAGGMATIEATVVRDMLPERASGLARAVSFQDDIETLEPTQALVRGCVVERAGDVAVFVGGEVDVAIESSVVRGPLHPGDSRCMSAQSRSDGAPQPALTVRSSLIERCGQVGVVFLDARGRVESTLLRDTAVDAAGSFGDGLMAIAALTNATEVSVVASVIRGSARAGVSSFAATVSLERTQLECNVIPLDVESLDGDEAVIIDAGGNACGCESFGACQSSSSDIAPPEVAAF